MLPAASCVGKKFMLYIAVFALAAAFLLQASGAIPASSVGGPMFIALAVFLGAFVVAIEEAWRRRRNALGWVVNAVLTLVAAFFVAPLAGFVMALALEPFMGGGTSLAASGGPAFFLAIAGVLGLTMLGCRGALEFAGRWR